MLFIATLVEKCLPLSEEYKVTKTNYAHNLQLEFDKEKLKTR